MHPVMKWRKFLFKWKRYSVPTWLFALRKDWVYSSVTANGYSIDWGMRSKDDLSVTVCLRTVPLLQNPSRNSGVRDAIGHTFLWAPTERKWGERIVFDLSLLGREVALRIQKDSKGVIRITTPTFHVRSLRFFIINDHMGLWRHCLENIEIAHQLLVRTSSIKCRQNLASFSRVTLCEEISIHQACQTQLVQRATSAL
jgi:hypothetical protein